MVVHDLAFDLMPETAPHVTDRWRRSFDEWLAGAAAVIVPTEATRADLLRLHRVDDALVHAIHHGADADKFSSVSSGEVDESNDGSASTGATSCPSPARRSGRTSGGWCRRSSGCPTRTTGS